MKHFLHLCLILLAPALLSAQGPDLQPTDPEDNRWDPRFDNGNALSGEWYSGVASLIRWQGSIIAAGRFTHAGELRANNIARYDGAHWFPLASGIDTGLNRDVRSLAAIGNDLFAGGYFDSAGGVRTGAVARWTGQSWSRVGDGLYGQVSALAVVDDLLYAAGTFAIGDGGTMTNIARWDGDAWESIGSRVNGNIEAMVIAGGYIYVGGVFDSAGGVRTGPVARLSLETGDWTPLGDELRDSLSFQPQVWALAVDGDGICVGGHFDRAGDMTVGHIARWNGSGWESLDGGVSLGWVYPSHVLSIAVTDGEIYAGGTFGRAGEREARSIARWDRVTQEWSNLGSGVDFCEGFECVTSVMALLPDGSDLYAGGNFTIAGEKPSRMIAHWLGTASGIRGTTEIDRSLTLSPTPFSRTTEIAFSLPTRASVTLSISDIQGREIARLIDETLPAGDFRTIWDGGNVPAGIYLCRLVVDGEATTRTIARVP